MENEVKELKVTDASAYVKQQAKTKLVSLPSGAVFEIKKITGRDYLKSGGISLQSSSNIADKNADEKQKIMVDNMTDAQKQQNIEVMNKTLCMAVVKPKLILIADDKITDAIPVECLDDKDYYALIKEITEYSFDDKKDLTFFR